MRILSLGGGVQSTTLLLMALAGDLPRPDAAIFADTGWERQATYRHMEWLMAQAEGRIPVYVVKQPVSIKDAHINALHKQAARIDSMPVHTATGPIKRGCTDHWKLAVISQKARELMGMASRGRPPKGARVEQLIGISLDEVHRMHDSDAAWLVNSYPLIDAGMTRNACLYWLKEHGYPDPPNSSCIGCPYHNNEYWYRLREESPVEWEEACQFDEAIRTGLPKVTAPAAYLHFSAKPLREAAIGRFAAAEQLTLEDMLPVCAGNCWT